jgi:hypothetical protein
MMDIRNKTPRNHPSLLPLRVALISAEKESPARPPQLTITDEQRALQLIGKMKTEYNKPLPFSCWKDESDLILFNLREVIGIHA